VLLDETRSEAYEVRLKSAPLLSDFVLEFEVQPVRSPASTPYAFGVRFRVDESSDRGYLVEIRNTPLSLHRDRWSVDFDRSGGAQITELVEHAFVQTLGAAPDVMHVRIDATGNRFRVVLNGVEVLTAVDNAFPTGPIALYVDSFSDTAQEVTFDNVVLSAPSGDTQGRMAAGSQRSASGTSGTSSQNSYRPSQTGGSYSGSSAGSSADDNNAYVYNNTGSTSWFEAFVQSPGAALAVALFVGIVALAIQELLRGG
jgi:hypothetical protein